jgi:hypothetical protein
MIRHCVTPSEREKLFQEALKLERERAWYVLANGALAAIIGAVVARLLH